MTSVQSTPKPPKFTLGVATFSSILPKVSCSVKKFNPKDNAIPGAAGLRDNQYNYAITTLNKKHQISNATLRPYRPSCKYAIRNCK